MHFLGLGFNSRHLHKYVSPNMKCWGFTFCGMMSGIERRSRYTRRPKGVLVGESGQEVVMSEANYEPDANSPTSKYLEHYA